MKGDCVEVDSGTLTGFQQVLVKPLPDRLHFLRFRHPSMILAGHDDESRLDAGRLELWHDPMRLLKRTLHRQAQLIPHARKQLQVCPKMQRTKKGPSDESAESSLGREELRIYLTQISEARWRGYECQQKKTQ